MYWFTPLSYSYTAIALNEFTWTVRILPLRCAAKPAVALRSPADGRIARRRRKERPNVLFPPREAMKCRSTRE